MSESSDIGSGLPQAERLRIHAYRRIGEVLGEGKPGNPSGANQYDNRGISEHSEIPLLTQAEMDRRWQARTIASNWTVLEPVLPAMKRPTINAAVRVIQRSTNSGGTVAARRPPGRRPGRAANYCVARPDS